MTPDSLLALIPPAFLDPVGFGINILLSTLVGGIMILVVLEIIGREFSEPVDPLNAFLLVLIVNIINMFGIIFILTPYLSFIPLYSLIIPLLIWIILVKFFFREMQFVHAAIAGVAGYFLTLIAVPYMVSFLRTFLPV